TRVALPLHATGRSRALDLVSAALVRDRIVVEGDRLAPREVAARALAFVVLAKRVEHRAVDLERRRAAEIVEHGLLRRVEPRRAGGILDRQRVGRDRAGGPEDLVAGQLAPAGQADGVLVGSTQRIEQRAALPA